ncbi:MAG: aspartate-semialdehyde dehydrogenase [Actinobacteria bacterium]|nr:aspartate-semialdehyde dehydrogenase [Actinomycetota bacterium]
MEVPVVGGPRVAVVGATGAVGREMSRILEERDFPLGELVPLASARSAGTRVPFGGRDVTVGELSAEALGGVDLAFFSAGAAVSRAFVPGAAAGGTVCVDNSSAFRQEPDVPLVIPELNGEELEADPPPRIVAVPNCTAITALMAVGPLHRAAGLRQIVISSYQSVSGAGRRAIAELAEQVGKLHGTEEDLLRPEPDALPVGDVFRRTIAYNVLALQGGMDEEDWTGEERKLLRESRKILRAPELEVQATVVRVPVVAGHSVAVFAAFERPISPDEAREVLGAAPGVRVVDDPERDVYPTPLDAAGIDDVLVGRIRRASGRDDALLLFASGDNLRKGAALNAVQIAERLFGR